MDLSFVINSETRWRCLRLENSWEGPFKTIRNSRFSKFNQKFTKKTSNSKISSGNSKIKKILPNKNRKKLIKFAYKLIVQLNLIHFPKKITKNLENRKKTHENSQSNWRSKREKASFRTKKKPVNFARFSFIKKSKNCFNSWFLLCNRFLFDFLIVSNFRLKLFV